MEIEFVDNRKLCHFTDLVGGTTFEYSGSVFLKFTDCVELSALTIGGKRMIYNAVNLASGDFHRFDVFHMVTPIEAKLVVTR